jgi:hypothetical protein
MALRGFDLKIGNRPWANRLPLDLEHERLPAYAYAESLCDYAAARLGPHELRAWIVWRLIGDGSLDHDLAEVVAAQVIDEQHRGAALQARARRDRGRHTRGHRMLGHRRKMATAK